MIFFSFSLLLSVMFFCSFCTIQQPAPFTTIWYHFVLYVRITVNPHTINVLKSYCLLLFFEMVLRECLVQRVFCRYYLLRNRKKFQLAKKTFNINGNSFFFLLFISHFVDIFLAIFKYLLGYLKHIRCT